MSFSGLRFDILTPFHQPLGGTESAICYLAAALRLRNHDVDIATNKIPDDDKMYDVVIVASAPAHVDSVRAKYKDAKIVLWNHMTPDQEPMKRFHEQRGKFDECVYVSAGQRDSFTKLDPIRFDSTVSDGPVIGNAISPFFENMYKDAEHILSDKECRGAYTSTPYRGLDLLKEIQEIPIDVYSSMAVYQKSDNEFSSMYEDLSHNPALKFHGSLAQPALARALRKAAFLVYPCTFQECHSIAILEAQAAGLMVITTQKAMKFEGHACVVSSVEDIPMVLRLNIERYKADTKGFAKEQFDQVKFINDNYTWAQRAVEWENLLWTIFAGRTI